MKMKKNVYFFNRIKGFYRGQYSLKYFKDKFLQYNVVYTDDDFFRKNSKGLFSIFERILGILFKQRAIRNSDIIWIPAMGYAATREWELIKQSKAFVILDYYVSQYENLTNEFKTVEKDSEEGKRLRQTEIDFLKRADLTFFLTNAERSYFLSYLDLRPDEIKSEILPLVVDRRRKARMPFANGLSARPVLAWWGTNLPLHGLSTLISGLHLLKERGVDFLFYLIINNETRGADNDSLFQQVHDLGLENNVIYQHQFSLHDFSLEDFLIEKVDLALGSFGGTRKGQVVLMNKVADAVSMSLPCLTEHSEGLQEFLAPGEEIFCCPAFPENIANTLETLIQQPSLLKLAASRLELMYESVFSMNSFYKKINLYVQ
jgi:glycosyltransferase involved in cell wall biosynthesis